MKYRLIIKPGAELDIMESAFWYEEQHAGLGRHFIDAVDEKLGKIKQRPLQYQLRYRNVRIALVKRFPYAIHFTVEQAKIIVLAVLSTHRNPRLWHAK